MGVENFKRWHWAVLGILAGGAMGFLTQASKPGDDGWSGRTIGQEGFERLVAEKPLAGHPMISNVRLYPSVVSPATGQTVAVVAFDELVQVGNSEQWKPTPTRFMAVEPLKPLRGPRKAPGVPIKQYLDNLSKQNPALALKYAWWAEPRNAYILWTGGGLFLLGVVWPTILNLLVGAGLGRPPTPKEEFDLSRFKGKREPKVEPVVVARNDGSLEELNEKLEAELQAAGVLDASPSADLDDSVADLPAIKPLTAGPLEAPAAPEPVVAYEKPSDAYKGGVFYPVAKAPVKHD